MSLLVFKEGEIINLVRVIENEDGSYSPYNREKPSVETNTTKTENHLSFFKKISEDMDMAIKMQMLKLKLKNISIKKEMRNRKRQENLKDSVDKLEEYKNCEKDISNLLSYLEIKKQITTKTSDRVNKRTFQLDENDSEDEQDFSEVALKDKHRTKVNISKSNKGTKDQKINELLKERIRTDSVLCKNLSEHVIKPSSSRAYPPKYDQQNTLSESFSIIKEHTENENVSIEVPCSESLSLSSRAELGRLHISEDSESIELEETPQDLWHIQRESLKHNKAYNLGLIAKHIGLEHNYNIKNPGDSNEILNNNFFENDFYNLSHFVASQTSVPYNMSKENSNCDTFFEIGKSKSYNRLPLYGRQAKLNSGSTNRDSQEYSTFFNIKEPEHHINYLQEIKTLENKYDADSYSSDNLLCTNNIENDSITNKKISEKIMNVEKPSDIDKNEASLGAISKKTMRCGHCKKRLTIVNIYNCRCGKIFCGQHRYSETHNCKYDYKNEGKKLIEQSNPLVIAKKLDKI